MLTSDEQRCCPSLLIPISHRWKMASLPVELLRLIYDYCDPPTVRNLRRVSRLLASIGYDYLIPPHFIARGANKDAERLLSIAVHERLRSSIESISFHFSPSDHQSANDLVHIVGMPLLDRTGWLNEKIQGTPALRLDIGCPSLVEEALMRLPSLKSVEVNHSKSKNPTQRAAGSCSIINKGRGVDEILSATRHCSLSSLSFMQLPLEFFQSRDRQRWSNCTRTFASLTRLELAIGADTEVFPQARQRATNGLGRALQLAPGLKSLSLSFIGRHGDSLGFSVSFDELLGGFTYENLSDLRLKGICCTNSGLSSFILRHASTLERLRLGGGYESFDVCGSIGGMTLHEGTWRSLFSSLRCRLPKLKRFHAAGCLFGGLSPVGWRERYWFCPVSDENWEELPSKDSPRGEWEVDSRELERYLLEGGEYPKQLVVVPARRP